MGNFIYDAVQARYGFRTTPSGWANLNAPCCQHRGQAPTRRKDKRAGFKLDGDTFVYNCFNCAFAIKHTAGNLLTAKLRDLLGWMGFTTTDIGKLDHKALAAKMRAEGRVSVILPDGLKSIMDWLEEHCTDLRVLQIANFLLEAEADHTAYYWTPDDNGIHLSQYIVTLYGDLNHATGWDAWPYLDQELPYRTHNGIEPSRNPTTRLTRLCLRKCAS
jgi:hypothetical protein